MAVDVLIIATIIVNIRSVAGSLWFLNSSAFLLYYLSLLLNLFLRSSYIHMIWVEEYIKPYDLL